MTKKITDKVELKRLWLDLVEVHSTIRESVERPNEDLVGYLNENKLTKEDYLNEKRYYHSGEEYGPDDKAIPVWVNNDFGFINPLDIGTHYELVSVNEIDGGNEYSIFSVEEI